MDHSEENSDIQNASVVIVSSEEEEEVSSHSNCTIISVDDNSDESDCEITDIQELQGEEKWLNIQNPLQRLNSLVQAGFTDPKSLLVRLFGMDEAMLPDDPNRLISLLLSLLAEPSPRSRLKHVCTLEHVLNLIDSSNSILVITGAGISVSCGIPDFRSRDGIYARLSRDYPDLSSPQAMFDMAYFRRNPVPFFKFAKELFPGQFHPSITHRLIALLEMKNKLLRNYTQNIDTLEQSAGVTRLIQCHGSFATASCVTCGHKVSMHDIEKAVLLQVIPYCPICLPHKASPSSSPPLVDETPSHGPTSSTSDACSQDGPPNSELDANQLVDNSFGVLKPDIVFFGEGLPNEFHNTLADDVKKADLVFVIGSSLKVRPVAHIPNALPPSIPQILINREPLVNHVFDVELLGDCDVVIGELCVRLGWQLENWAADRQPLAEVSFDVLRDQFLETRNCATSIGHRYDSMSINDEQQSGEGIESAIDVNGSDVEEDDASTSDLLWDVASSLAPNTFTHIHPNQYVFSGAEIYLDPCQDLDDDESDEASSNVQSETDPMPASANVNEEGKSPHIDAVTATEERSSGADEQTKTSTRRLCNSDEAASADGSDVDLLPHKQLRLT